MQSRCCWPPESAAPERWSFSFTSSQSAARRRFRSTRSSISRRDIFQPRSLGPAATLSYTLIIGNGFGFWNTIPTMLRTSTGLVAGA